MRKQNCSQCGSEWNSSVVSTACPFCGATLIDDSKRFTDISDVFNFIFNEYGLDIINEKRKFISLLGDYAPTMEKERRLVKIAVEADVYKTLLDLNSIDGEERNICIEKMVVKLQQQWFLSLDWSQKVVEWFVKCLNWNLPFAVSYSAPFSPINVEYSVNSTGFDPIAYEAFSRDPETKDFDLLKKAYVSGMVLAGVRLAVCYIEGVGCSVDVKKGVTLLEACARFNSNEAHYELAKLYFFGKHVNKDYEQAFSLFLFAAERGHSWSQNYVGDCCFYGYGTKKDNAKAIEWYTNAYEQGNSSAASMLGAIYYVGDGVEVDDDKSFFFFKYAADRGSVFSQYFLHFFYFGNEKYQNYEKGLEYLFKAAEANYTDAQIALGKLYCLGNCGLEKSEEKSYKWFMRAAELENAEAERIVGVMYTSSFYVVQDSHKSLEWLQKAVAHGDIQAHIAIADLYMNGSLGTRDYSNGDKYLSSCRRILDKDKSYLQSGLLYKDIAKAYYKYGKKQAGHSRMNFLAKATSIYHVLYSNGHDDVLYDYVWSVFVDGVLIDYPVDTIKLVDALKIQAESEESARCASLLSKIYRSGYPPCSEDLLGDLDGKGQNVPKIKYDNKEAEKWIKIAIQRGDTSAACNFAIELCNDLKRPVEAFEYAKLAHEMDDFHGTFLLGLCYKKGIGVKKDRSKAKELLMLAKTNGYSEK